MLKILGFVFKLLWRVLRLIMWLVAIILSLTIGFARRQTLGRSNVYVRRDWNDPVSYTHLTLPTTPYV